MRRKLVIDEAKSIGTTYLRSRLLNTDHQKLKALYVDYVDHRIDAYNSYNDKEKFKKISEESFSLQQAIWNNLVEVSKKDRGALESAYAYALNEMLDNEFERTIILDKNLPFSIYIIIMLIAFVTLGLLNFDRGYTNEGGNWPMFFFILLFSVVVCLIYDLDRPHFGLVRIGQDAMYALKDSLIKM